MKFKLLTMTAMLLASGVASAAVDAEKIYNSVIEQKMDLIIHANDDDYSVEEGIGIWEVANGLGSDKALERVGYLIRDISGDGIPELLIGLINDDQESPGYCKGNQIFMIYTIANNEPVLVTEGWARSMSCTLPGNQFFYNGSSGAQVSLTGKYSLSHDGQSLTWSDFYFTYPDENSEDISVNFYSNKTGDADPETSTKLEMDYDGFEKLSESWSGMTTPMDGFIPFAKLKKLDTSNQGSQCEGDSEVSAAFAPEDLSVLGDYQEIKASTSDPVVKVAITTKGKVSDFKVLGLEFMNADDDGNITFRENAVYRVGDVTCDKSVVISLSLIGTIPNNGISFKDANGNLKKYTISESGMDGSIILSEFK